MSKLTSILVLLISLLTVIGCGTEQGELSFYANGEDFVRDGFITKDGWAITFDNVYVTLASATAYQSDPPFDASEGGRPSGYEVAVAGKQTVDLKHDLIDGRALLGSIQANVGQFNAIGWEMPIGDNGSVQLIGEAQKDSETVVFDLTIDRAFSYVCGEYVGDVRNGFVNAGETGDIEMTFHFDHVFGDGDSSADEPLNIGAVGFEPFAAVTDNGLLVATLTDLEQKMSNTDFDRLLDTLGTLGHVGEGHCYEAENGYTGSGY